MHAIHGFAVRDTMTMQRAGKKMLGFRSIGLSPVFPCTMRISMIADNPIYAVNTVSISDGKREERASRSEVSTSDAILREE
jgi:hypothetical protein